MSAIGGGWLHAHRTKLVAAAVLAALLGVGHALKGMDFVQRLYGKGYVPFMAPVWKAKQAAAKHDRALVIYAVDPRHAASARLDALTPDPEVEPLIDRLVWYREERPAEGPPAPPTLEVVTADMEVTLAGPWTLEGSTSAATLRGWLLEGIARHGERTR